MTASFDFTQAEQLILNYWQSHKTFEQGQSKNSQNTPYIFYDGPPFATGLPHYGHILASTIKDTIGRFFHQQGYSVERRFGWDCHGLPVEYEIDKREGIKDREQVINEITIEKYNAMCRSIVDMYTSEWETAINRLGRWVSFDNGYKTMDTTFMESVWHIFALLFDNGLVYRGYRVMPFSTACSTPLSNFEANQNYQEVSDPGVIVLFRVSANDMDVDLMVFTTTPWTLPSNCALAVDKNLEYACVESQGSKYLLLKSRVEEYFLIKKDNNEGQNNTVKKAGNKKEGVVIFTMKGQDLINKEYTPLFPYFQDHKAKGFFKVLPGSFIQEDTGTGIVHCAPGFGEEDYNCFVENKLISLNDAVPCPVNDKGLFTKEVPDYAGKYVKDCDSLIIRRLKEQGKIFLNTSIVHRYPFCWRSDTPLLYKLVPNWFIRVSEFKDVLLKNNEEINWVPGSIKYKKFHNWLENARDWSVSRNRFWGTPIPIWADEEYKDFVVVRSVEELERLSGVKVFGNMGNCSCLVDVDNSLDAKKNNIDANNNFINDNNKSTSDNNNPTSDNFINAKNNSTNANTNNSNNDAENTTTNNNNTNSANNKYPKMIKKHTDECYKNTDIHRERIDHITFKLNNKTYKRIDEVLDCWFESGSMPYAQNHWPFTDNKANLRMPADFIGEGVDQTRGWFYTLHVISSLLFDSPAFKNVIVNGIVLAEDGKKMSKRLKNYPDPMEIITKYGSDSLRLTLLSSPVVVAENFRFSEDKVREVFRCLMIPWYNCVRFYMDSTEDNKTVDKSCMQYDTHKEKDTSLEKNGEQLYCTTSEKLQMDEWILSRFDSLSNFISKQMQKYTLNNLLPQILEFVDDLSNWYVRMNRNDIRNGKGVLKEVLLRFSVVMAPLAPFFAEYSYQVVRDKSFGNNTVLCEEMINKINIEEGKIKYTHGNKMKDVNGNIKNSDKIHLSVLKSNQAKGFNSVHLERYPCIKNIEPHPFNKVKQIILGIRSIRETSKISLKTPLRDCTVICSSEFVNDLDVYMEIILNECNIFSLQFKTPEDYKYKETIKPNFEEIMENKKEKIMLINKMSMLQKEELLRNSKIKINDTEIKIQEILYKKEIIGFNENISKSYKEFGLILNTNLDDELIEKRNAREFYSQVQKIRKNNGIKVEDKRKVWVDCEELKVVVEKYYADVIFVDFVENKELCCEDIVVVGERKVCVKLVK